MSIHYPVCYICGYDIVEEPRGWESHWVHEECFQDSVAPHYHLWLVADNGRNIGRDGASAIFRRAPRFASREQAMRAAKTRYGRDREYAMALRCNCVIGVKEIVPKA